MLLEKPNVEAANPPKFTVAAEVEFEDLFFGRAE